MYEVTSRKGGQRQQPYGRPCDTGGQRQQPYGDGPARSACPSPAEKKARGSDSEAKATANLMAAQQLSWILRRKKTPGSRRRARRVVRGEGGEGGAKSGVFHFRPKNPKTQFRRPSVRQIQAPVTESWESTFLRLLGSHQRTQLALYT